MKIIKHARTSHVVLPPPTNLQPNQVAQTYSPAVGQLVGMDVKGVLDVSNCYSLPFGSLSSDGSEESNATSTSSELL
jgi:hypothetical protein